MADNANPYLQITHIVKHQTKTPPNGPATAVPIAAGIKAITLNPANTNRYINKSITHLLSW